MRETLNPRMDLANLLEAIDNCESRATPHLKDLLLILLRAIPEPEPPLPTYCAVGCLPGPAA